MGWALPCQSLIKEMLYRLVYIYSSFLQKYFLNWEIFSPSSLMTTLCQANMKLASTAGMIWTSIRRGENSVIHRVSRNPILYASPSDFVSSSASYCPTIFKEWSEAVIERESGRSSLSGAPVAASNANRLQLGEWGDRRWTWDRNRNISRPEITSISPCLGLRVEGT